MEYKNVGGHVEDLADGRMVEPGLVFELDEESIKDPFNKDKIDREVFIPIEQAAAPNATDGAIELAKKHKVNLADVAGTGTGGRITQDDVEQHVAASAEPKGS